MRSRAFNLGSILAVQATGLLLPVIGWPGVLLARTIIAALFAIGAANSLTDP